MDNSTQADAGEDSYGMAEARQARDPLRFPESLRRFIGSCHWTFAKTYAPTWPHEYIVRDRVDGGLFLQLVEHIRAHGYEGKFYAKTITYFDDDGRVYWTMGAPVEETIIVNRCMKEQTYEYRLNNGTLPRREVPSGG